MYVRGWIFALALTLAPGCGPALGAGEQRTPNLFADNCAFCHGANGEGNDAFQFPGIAGLPEWYVAAQLTKFRDGIRGAHVDDQNGLKMRPMARVLPPEDAKSIAAYVASLPVSPPSRALVTGDAEKGKAAYQVCVACHGPDGKGNQQLNAPPIVQLDDWYLKLQLTKFKAGIRGANPKDVTGGQMRPMAASLADEDAINNVVAYIGTLH